MRRLVPLALVCALALVTAHEASAAPPLKQQFAPLSLQIKHIGDDIGKAVQGADGQTDAQIAKQFGGLARRTAAASSSVGKLKGASGAALTAQRKLQLALAKAAVDLNAIYSAALAHSASKAKAATVALLEDSPAVKSSRAALTKAAA